MEGLVRFLNTLGVSPEAIINILTIGIVTFVTVAVLFIVFIIYYFLRGETGKASVNRDRYINTRK